MIEEIVPNLYRSEIPLPGSPLKWLNSYIVKGGSRFLIIDTGFNREECLNAMSANLQALSVDLNRTDIFITHLHVDHIGLAGRLVREGTTVYFNELEARRMSALQDRWQEHWGELIDLYIANGFPADGALAAMKSHPAHAFGLEKPIAFAMVNDGDRVEIGDFQFRCVATPGHSPGHLCLYEERRKILVAGDHILFDITPNITYWREMEDALARYLDSLEKVSRLEVNLVLTGHRRLFPDLRGRCAELQEHHRARLQEVLVALGDGEKNLLQIAPRVTWDITAKSWDEFPPPQKWFAFGETMAHVRYLEDQGRVLRRRDRNGLITYALA
jgi:glyoxylase-like metal-dependent hydrolase (beta-lactamase superfamily II)